MRGNGACENACNTSGCGYDGGDCLCSAACSPSDFGTCKKECVTPACDFDKFGRGDGCTDEFLVTLNLYSSIVNASTFRAYNHSACEQVAACQFIDLYYAYENQACVSACNGTECLSSMGYCSDDKPQHCSVSFDTNTGHCFKCADGFVQYLGYCLESCPRGFETLPDMPQLCRNRIQDETEIDEIYVFEDLSDNGGNGSYRSPFSSLAVGLAAVWQKRTVIYLLGESASVTTELEHKEFLTHINVQNLLADSRYLDLTVKSLTCGETDHEKCSPSPCTVTWNAGFTLEVKAKNLTFINVSFNSTCALNRRCDTLNNTNLLVAGPSSMLSLIVISTQSVNFTHIRANSIITIDFGALNLTNVSFGNVMACSGVGCAVIVQIGECPSLQYCGSIIYTGGTVSFVNNIGWNEGVGMFLLLRSVTKIDITGVKFYSNLLTKSLANNGLIDLKNFLLLRITDCIFEKNALLGGLIIVTSAMAIPRTADTSSVASLFLQTHITFQNLQFKNNVSRWGMIYLNMASDLLNIVFSRCEFSKNIAVNQIVVITYSGNFNRATISTIQIQNINTETTKFVNIPASWLNISDLVFSGHPGFRSILGLYSLTNAKIHNVQFLGNVNKGGKALQEEIQHVFNFDDAGITIPIYSDEYSTDCEILAVFYRMQNFEARNFVLVNNVCVTQSSAILIFIEEATASLQSFFAKNNISNKGCAVLDIYISTQLTLDNFTALDNRGGNKGAICITSSTDGVVRLKDSVITGNRGKGAGIYVENIKLLEIESTLFKDNVANTEYGGAIALFSNSGHQVAIELFDAVFTGNQAMKGAAIYLSSISGLVSIMVSGSSFSRNNADSGAGIYAENIKLLKIESTLFQDNNATMEFGGAIALLVDSEHPAAIEISDTAFTGNRAMKGAAVSLSSIGDGGRASVMVSGSSFSENNAKDSGASLFVDKLRILSAESFVSRCKFTGESSLGAAVALYFGSGMLSVLDSLFSRNSGDISSCILLQTYQEAEILIKDTVFEMNELGPVITKSNVMINTQLHTLHCTFIKNSYASMMMQGGGWTDIGSELISSRDTAVYLSTVTADLTNTTFFNNSSPSSGGAVYIHSSSLLNCNGCIFEENSAASDGGAVFIEQEGVANIIGCLFQRNRAEMSGSAAQIQTTNGFVSHISDTQFFSNKAGIIGTINLQSAELNISTSVFDSNTAIGSAGISATYSSLTIADSVFRNQVAAEALFLSVLISSTARIYRSLFENSIGLGECVKVDSSKLTVEDSIFRNLTISSALVLTGDSVVFLRNCTVREVVGHASGSVILTDSIGLLSIERSVFSQCRPEAVLALSVKTLVIEDSKFVGGFGKYGSAVSCYDCEDTTIMNSLFAEQVSSSGAVYFRWTRDTDKGGNVVILNTRWENNLSEGDSGGLFVLGYQMIMKECFFINNAALDKDSVAGAMYLSSASQFFCNYTIQNSSFVDNSAEKAGGAIYWKGSQPLLMNCSFANNSAEYGSNIGSFAASLNISISHFDDFPGSRALESTITAAPGQRPRGTIIVSILDHYGELVNIDNSSIGQLVSMTSGASISDTVSVTAISGQFTFDNFIVFANQHSIVNLNVFSPTLALETRTLSFFMRDCIPGESTASRICQICAERTYSFDPSLPCKECLAHTQCLGNFTVLPFSGYWRPGKYSDLVFECPLKGACKGGGPFSDGSISYQGQCAQGYKGNMCQSCDIGYSRTTENKCGKCPPLGMNLLRIIFIAIGVLVVNAILLISSLKSALQTKAQYSIYFKILTNYWQLVLLVTEFKLKWPDPILDLFSAQQKVDGVAEQISSIDCLLAENRDTSDVYYTKMIYIALLPLLVILAAVLFWTCAAVIKQKRIYLTRELLATIIIGFFIIHPTLMKSLFSLFSCQQIQHGEFWLTTDMAIRCGDKDHVFYSIVVGLSAIIVWVIGFPLLCLGVLIKYRRRHSEVWIRLQYGFLLNGYRTSRFYWEFIILGRKFAVICCFVFITNSTQVQALTVQVVLLVVLFFQYEVKPYSNLSLNNLELVAISAANLTIFSGLYYLSQDLTDSGKWFFFIVIIVINALFFALWGRAMLKELVLIAARAVPSIGSRLCPSLFERDSYIEDFITSADCSRDYSQFELSDLKDVYRSVREKEPRGLICQSSVLLNDNLVGGKETQFFTEPNSARSIVVNEGIIEG